MAQRIAIVDAFTDEPFAGKPAGVCLLPTPTPDAWMQAVAGELNLSETAFVVPRDDGDDLRWFTPTTEVDLCGHATLAATHVLGRDARFHTRSGVLACGRAADGAITLDVPAARLAPVAIDASWPDALGLPADRLVASWADDTWALVEVATATDVRAIVPDRPTLLGLGGRFDHRDGPARQRAVVVAVPGELGDELVAVAVPGGAGVGLGDGVERDRVDGVDRQLADRRARPAAGPGRRAPPPPEREGDRPVGQPGVEPLGDLHVVHGTDRRPVDRRDRISRSSA
jgi:hypothetical protein